MDSERREWEWGAVGFGVASIVLAATMMAYGLHLSREREAVERVAVVEGGPEACPYGAVRMERGSPWTCLTTYEADGLAEDCYRDGEACRIETPAEHAGHGDEGVDCILESWDYRTVGQMRDERGY